MPKGLLSRFAHLAGVRAEDQTDPEDRAEDETEDPEAEGDDPEEPEAGDDPEDEPDESAEDETETAEARAARARERARCAAIFASPVSAGRVPLAARLAFTTTLPAKAVIGILGDAEPARAEGKRGGLAAAMQRRGATPPLGGGSPGASRKSGSLADNMRRLVGGERKGG